MCSFFPSLLTVSALALRAFLSNLESLPSQVSALAPPTSLCQLWAPRLGSAPGAGPVQLAQRPGFRVNWILFPVLLNCVLIRPSTFFIFRSRQACIIFNSIISNWLDFSCIIYTVKASDILVILWHYRRCFWCFYIWQFWLRYACLYTFHNYFIILNIVIGCAHM